MYLVKTLGKEHRDDALKRGKIRIGTINYYRKIEDASRQDAEEGMGHIVWAGDELGTQENVIKNKTILFLKNFRVSSVRIRGKQKILQQRTLNHENHLHKCLRRS